MSQLRFDAALHVARAVHLVYHDATAIGSPLSPAIRGPPETLLQGKCFSIYAFIHRQTHRLIFKFSNFAIISYYIPVYFSRVLFIYFLLLVVAFAFFLCMAFGCKSYRR